MLDRAQTNLTDRMIASLEEANTRSYQQLKGTDQSSPSGQLDPRRSDRRPAGKRRLSRASLWFFALVGLILPASMYVFTWGPSYRDATKLTVARWVNASTLPTRQDKPAPEPVIPPEVERRLQRMADELADVRRQIEQLRDGQDERNRSSAVLTEQVKAGMEQMARDHAKVADQLKSELAQLAERDVAIAEQMKATRDQLAEATSSRPIDPARKVFRRRRVSKPGARR